MLREGVEMKWNEGGGAALPSKVDDGARWVRDNLSRTLGTRFAIAASKPRLVLDALYPGEREFLAGAVAKRQAEFGTARVCARDALAQLGEPAIDLTPYPDRSPRWPAGVVGSISHVAECCAVAATNDPSVLACGIDVEGTVPLPRELEALVCTAREQAWLSGRAGADRGVLGKVLFSAKEAVFKCQFPMNRAMLEFKEVELELDCDGGGFDVVGVSTRKGDCGMADFMRKINGRFVIGQTLMVSVATVDATVEIADADKVRGQRWKQDAYPFSIYSAGAGTDSERG